MTIDYLLFLFLPGGHNSYIQVSLMGLLKAASLAIFFGSLYTIFRKYQTVIDLSPQAEQFNQPLLQSFIIFIGMSSIVFIRPWLGAASVTPAKETGSSSIMLYFVPSLLDVLGTIIDTAGLYYTSVSVSQMLKGSIIFFTYIISLVHLKRKLTFKKHFYMMTIILCLVMVAVSNVTHKQVHPQHIKSQSSPIFGNGLIVLSQLMFSFMFIYEEKILKKYNLPVEEAVFWEGIWGVLIAGVALALFSVVQTPISPQVYQSCIIICSNYKLLGALFMTAFCIGPFNFFGMRITQQGSALERCIICTMRMIVVWAFSLAFGWEEFRTMQAIGYTIMTYCVYKFNQPEKDTATEQIKAQNNEEEDELKINPAEKQIDEIIA